MQEILFITSNKTKLDIANEVVNGFGIKFVQKKLDIKEIQGLDIDEVAYAKAIQASTKVNKKFVVDDSGIYIKALKRFPGALLKETNNSIGADGLIKLMSKEKNRDATFVNVLVFYDPETKKSRTFHTIINGKIAQKVMGSRKVGWAIERIFIPQSGRKTIAQFNDAEWDNFWNWFKLELHYNKFAKWFQRSRPS